MYVCMYACMYYGRSLGVSDIATSTETLAVKRTPSVWPLLAAMHVCVVTHISLAYVKGTDPLKDAHAQTD